MTFVTTAFSKHPGVQDAVAELLKRLPSSQRLVLYFASSSYPPDALAAAMEKAFSPATVVGCTTAGEIVSGSLLKHSVVAMAFSADAVDDLAVEVLHGLGSGKDPVPEALDKLAKHFGAGPRDLNPERYVGIVLLDGLSHSEERIMDSLGVRTDVLFVGGSAGDDLAFAATHVFANGEAFKDSGVLVLMRVDRGFSILKTQSFVSTGKQLVATRVDEAERTVLEFDGRPARLAYAKALGIPPEQLSEAFMTHPVGLMANGIPFVRSPQQMLGDSIKFYCSIREGSEVEILEATDLVEDTRRALERERLKPGGAAAIVNFNCILRTLELERRGAVEAYGRLFTDIPTVGLSTYGEAFLGHMNQTATMLILNERAA